MENGHLYRFRVLTPPRGRGVRPGLVFIRLVPYLPSTFRLGSTVPCTFYLVTA
jgi:hypothetical protein